MSNENNLEQIAQNFVNWYDANSYQFTLSPVHARELRLYYEQIKTILENK